MLSVAFYLVNRTFMANPQASLRVMDAKRIRCHKACSLGLIFFFPPKDCYANLGDLQTAAKLRFKRNVSSAND